MTVRDPDVPPNSDAQTFVIGGLTVSKDTYFCFYSDTSGSMNSTIEVTAEMSSVPEVVSKVQLAAGTSMELARGTQAGRVNDPLGLTDSAHLCVVPWMFQDLEFLRVLQ